MNKRLQALLAQYDPHAAPSQAITPPSSWYLDEGIAQLENQRVFGRTWQLAARHEELQNPGDYVALDIAGEPILVVRDDGLRAFYNVCRHHAAQIAPSGRGCVKALHCPYHGWTYNLDGSLRNAPHLPSSRDFDYRDHGLMPLRVDTWAGWVFVCLDPHAPDLAQHLGSLADRLQPLQIESLRFRQRVSYELDCNWKVFVDNYLDGGYHVPFIHKELDSALDGSGYRIETAENFCLQSCPTGSSAAGSLTSSAAGALTSSAAGAVRGGDMAYYYWLYPNLMINWYEGVMDVNLVLPRSANSCVVHFDYYFAGQTEDFCNQSIAVAHRVQLEDASICGSVQRGLRSASYEAGRLVPAREAGEQLFHRLLHHSLTA